jgi:uncharacterized protein YggT (Ycf19 family)
MNSNDQRILMEKVTQSVWLAFGVIEGMIALRVLLRLMGANPQNPFAEVVYGLTRPFLLPFATLANQPRVEDLVLEVNSIVAMLVYGLIAWVIVQGIRILLDPMRGGSVRGAIRS